MLVLKRVGIWGNAYEVIRDRRVIAVYDSGFWNQDGLFTLAGRRYVVRGRLDETRLTLIDDRGAAVAEAVTGWDRFPNAWTVHAAGETFEFDSLPFVRTRTEIHADARLLGTMWRPSRWRRMVAIDVAAMPVPVRIFVLAAIVSGWDRAVFGRAWWV